MSNVHGLFSGKNNNDDDSSDDEDNNNRFVGGIDSRGGGRYERELEWKDTGRHLSPSL